MSNVPVLTEENTPRIVREGVSGIESIRPERLGAGFGVWRVETSCKRNDFSLAYGGGADITIFMWPQEGEGEYYPLDKAEQDDVALIELDLPRRSRHDFWIGDTHYDKHGGYITVFLTQGVHDFMTDEQVKRLEGDGA